VTLKRTLVTNDDGVTRETLVDSERVQPEEERPLPQLPPLGLLPDSNWSKHGLAEARKAAYRQFRPNDWQERYMRSIDSRNPGIDSSGWIGIGSALVIVALLALAAFLVLRFSGCAPPDEQTLTNKPPDIGIPDKPKPLGIAWAGTLDVATPYPARLAGAREWTLVGTGLEWAPVGRTSEIVYLVGPRGISILLPVEWCADSEATQDVSFHRDWKGRVDYRWTRR